MGDEHSDPLGPLGSSRREFIKKMVAAGFAAPMIGSFSFAELASASTTPQHSFPNQTHHEHHHHDDHGHGHKKHNKHEKHNKRKKKHGPKR